MREQDEGRSYLPGECGGEENRATVNAMTGTASAKTASGATGG
jgi:hypothetical protein